MSLDRAGLIAHARASIMRGSRSFATASRLFDRTTRERVWLLYAWCRACDDLADAQDHGGAGLQDLGGIQDGAAERLATIRRLTDAAFSGAATGDAAFDAIGQLARETAVTRAMAEDVIAGFALDAAGWRPVSEAELLRYCYHVGGAVGVMMAVVMGIPPGDEDTLDRAADLGIAFQLANVARDVAEDHAAGRCYLPSDWLREAGIEPRELLAHRAALARIIARLAAAAAPYEASARAGARRLSFRRRWAVLAAAGIYGAIAREAARRGEGSLNRRVTVSGAAKLGFVLRGLARAVLPGIPAPRPALSRRQLAGRGG